MEDMIYWIWLSLACTPGSTTFGKLIREFSTAREIYEAEDRAIASAIGYRTSDRANLTEKDLEKAKAIYEFCKKHHVGILTFGDKAYPDSLRTISDPPVLMYYRGVLPDFNSNLFISAVGTRKISDYGRKNAFKIGHDLARAGAIVVSGMAEGIDGIAMAGAISAGGTTVAVIGSGINICYPPQHQTLAREIVKRGCVLTEYAPGTKPTRISFPKRNRIISGLSAATIVFEGPERSGSLITGRCAKEQGRAVYALPGNIESKNSYAPNLLIKEGARVCTRAEDVLNDFTDKYPTKINLFNLKDRLEVNMMDVLSDYQVSATCPSDDIFLPPRISNKQRTTEEPIVIDEPFDEQSPNESFDKAAIALYKRIPMKGGCSIESLVTEETPLRLVMKHLLKLEVSGFVVLLPGEMVARKFK